PKGRGGGGWEKSHKPRGHAAARSRAARRHRVGYCAVRVRLLAIRGRASRSSDGWIVVTAGSAVTRWPVSVVGAPPVGAGGGGGAVGVQGQGPAPAVDDDQVVEGTQWNQVAQRGRATLRPWDQVMNLAHAGGLVTAGERAVRVAARGGAAQVRRDDRLGPADVERQRDIERQARPR